LNSILIDENTFVEANPSEFMLVQACAFSVGNRTRTRVYFLSADKPEDKFRWMTAIRAVMTGSNIPSPDALNPGASAAGGLSPGRAISRPPVVSNVVPSGMRSRGQELELYI